MTPRHRLILLLALLLAVGCGKTLEPSKPGEMVDVPPPIEVDTEGDIREEVRVDDFAGALPEDFPKDLPLYQPSSLVDFGETSRGFSVSLLSPDGLPKVRRSLYERLDNGGWQTSDGSGPGESVVLRKDGRRVWLTFEDGRPGTIYRFEY